MATKALTTEEGYPGKRAAEIAATGLALEGGGTARQREFAGAFADVFGMAVYGLVGQGYILWREGIADDDIAAEVE